jgi:hypothetical protein
MVLHVHIHTMSSCSPLLVTDITLTKTIISQPLEAVFQELHLVRMESVIHRKDTVSCFELGQHGMSVHGMKTWTVQLVLC